MRILIDTHVFVWTIINGSRLPRIVKAALVDPDNEILVSAATAYEIEYKRERDPVLGALPRDLDATVEALRFEWAPLEPAQALLAGRLPRLHGDPWDRVIVAQALMLQATIATADRRIAAYGAPVLW